MYTSTVDQTIQEDLFTNKNKNIQPNKLYNSELWKFQIDAAKQPQYGVNRALLHKLAHGNRSIGKTSRKST